VYNKADRIFIFPSQREHTWLCMHVNIYRFTFQ